MKITFLLLVLVSAFYAPAQIPVDLSAYNKKSGATASVNNNVLNVSWPVNKTDKGRLVLNLNNAQPLFQSIEMSTQGSFKQIAQDLDPSFVLTIGKRDLISQNGWNIFFDKVPLKPFHSHLADIDKRAAVLHPTVQER